MQHQIVSRQEWLKARIALLKREKAWDLSARPDRGRAACLCPGFASKRTTSSPVRRES